MADARISGFHAAAADRAEGRVDLQARFVPHPHATFLVRVASDVLIGQAIRTGDLCIVDRSLAPKHGDIVIATTPDDVLVRRLEIPAQGRPRLWTDPPGPPIPVDPDSGVELWGVVSAVVRGLR
jgi:DNA polymerase V